MTTAKITSCDGTGIECAPGEKACVPAANCNPTVFEQKGVHLHMPKRNREDDARLRPGGYEMRRISRYCRHANGDAPS